MKFSYMPFQEFKKKSRPSLQSAKEQILNRIQFAGEQEQLNSLSKILNNIMRDQQFKEKEVATKILNKIPQKVREGMGNVQIDDKLKVTTSEANERWKEYNTLSREYKKKLEQGIEEIASENKVNEALRAALVLQGSLNSLQGKAFEILLQTLIPLVTEKASKTVDSVVEELVKILDSNKEIKTLGTQSNTISFEINEKRVKISSPGKTDVLAKSPFLTTDEELKISAKNYSKLRDIHLLSKASVVGLISQWPIEDDDTKNYYYNALGVWEPDQYLQDARELFAIQALAGRGDAAMANILFLNIRSRVNSIQAISIKSLLAKIGQEGNIQNAFKMVFNPLPVYTQGEMRTTNEEFGSRIQQILLTASLTKQHLYAKYISQLK